jgi:acetate---CoA ligase (ADP-forming)
MDLTPLMKPRSLAVVGASSRMNRATRVIANLQRFGYAGRIVAVNPRYTELHGLPCYPDLASLPEPVDTVVVAIPAPEVPAVLTAAVERGVRGAVVLSSGFGEAGPAGQARQAIIDRLVAERGLLVCGPNCYGLLNVRTGAAAFSADMRDPLAGPLAVVSQSGGFGHQIAEHLMHQRRVGVGYVVSCGNQGGVTVEDYAEFLVNDPDVSVIGLYVEGFKQPAKLRTVAARARELRKPVVALKVGRSENARQAALAHTGSHAGTPETVDRLLGESGIIAVTNLNEMIDTLALLPAARAMRRPRWRTAVLSGLGGECGRSADAADREGVELPPLSPASIAALRAVMPDFGNPRNPLDGTGAMYEIAEIFPRAVDTLLADEAVDVLAVNMRATVPRPGGGAPSREFARALAKAVRAGTDRLVFCYGSHASGDLDPEVIGPLAEVGVPFLESTETAMQALRHAREHREFLSRPAPGEITP